MEGSTIHFTSLGMIWSLGFKIAFFGFWGLNERAGVSASTNLLRNINNVDRDLSYYGVEVVGHNFENSTKKEENETDDMVSD